MRKARMFVVVAAAAPIREEFQCGSSGTGYKRTGTPSSQTILVMVSIGRYTICRVIGQGSYGTVCEAVDNRTKEKVAIKRIRGVFEHGPGDAVRVLRELKLLRILRHHPDVVEIKDVILPEDPLRFADVYIVFERMDTDLHNVILENDDLTASHHRVFLYQLLRGLAFVHAHGVLHRDLKPKNILANASCKLKLCDFGLARPLDCDTSPVVWSDYVATRWYRAPELCGAFFGRYTRAVDIWSIGCIFAEVLTREPLFKGKDSVDQLHLITDLLGKPEPSFIEHVSNKKARLFLENMPEKPPCGFQAAFDKADPNAVDLLKSLIALDPAQRPSAEEALRHRYFDGMPSIPPIEPAEPDELLSIDPRHVSVNEVRIRIFEEILHYHPEVRAIYEAHRLAAAASHMELETELSLKKQFVETEQRYNSAKSVRV